MRATPRAAEQLPHLVGEPTGDRQTDELLVVVLDLAADRVRVRLEMHDRVEDLHRRKRHDEVDHHVMHDERTVVAVEVQTRRFAVRDRAPQPHAFGGLAHDLHVVHAVMDQVAFERRDRPGRLVEMDIELLAHDVNHSPGIGASS